jgi:hypothetical protein
VWPLVIVVFDPGFDFPPGVIEAQEQAFVQQFIAHPAIEAFAEAVLYWFAGCDKMPVDGILLPPGQNSIRRELRAVVRNNHSRFASSFNQLCHLTSYSPAGNRRVRDRRQTFAGDIIDEVQDPKPTAVSELIMHEVH